MSVINLCVTPSKVIANNELQSIYNDYNKMMDLCTEYICAKNTLVKPDIKNIFNRLSELRKYKKLMVPEWELPYKIANDLI